MGTNKATRAFQPKICAAGAVRTGGFAGCLAHAKPRSREGKRTSSVLGFRWAVFNFRCSFRRAADGSPRVRGLADGLTRSREGRCGATDVFFATDEHGFSRIIAGGMLWATSTLNFLESPLYGMEAIAPSPPTPLP